MSDKALIIFTRNPELGKGKRRLAATVGDGAALEIYKFLLQHTRAITTPVDAQIHLWYSERIHKGDDWSNDRFEKFLQVNGDLGDKMRAAFNHAFKNHNKVIIIGSDLYDLTTAAIDAAFKALDTHDAVIGPATDGGYYLLGFKNEVKPAVFHNKNWGTATVFKDTLEDLKESSLKILEPRNDVDYYEDIKDVAIFEPYLKHMHVK